METWGPQHVTVAFVTVVELCSKEINSFRSSTQFSKHLRLYLNINVF